MHDAAVAASLLVCVTFTTCDSRTFYQGSKTKMSSSVDSSAIFVTDTPAAVKKKINSYAFSGGQATKELQAELGANIDVDVAYQYLSFFLEDDDELKRARRWLSRLPSSASPLLLDALGVYCCCPCVQIGEEYKAGRMQSGAVKAKLIDVLVVSLSPRSVCIDADACPGPLALTGLCLRLFVAARHPRSAGEPGKGH
jgi:hypothetical protein